MYVDADASLRKLYPDLTFVPAPYVLHPAYPQFIRNVVKEHQVDYYIPLIDEELPIAHSLSRDTDFTCKLIAPQFNFVHLTLNKLKLMERLSELGISEIPTWSGDNPPVDMSGLIAKPIFGRGSRGVRRINSLEKYRAYCLLEERDPASVLLQKHYGGTEYTIGVLADANNRLLAISSRKVLSKKGVTIRAVTVNEPIIEQLVDKIQTHLRPSGPYNVQLIIDQSGVPRVFEINPRFSTTLVMSYAGGLDEISLFISANSDSAVVRRPAVGVELHRTWKNNFVGTSAE